MSKFDGFYLHLFDINSSALFSKDVLQMKKNLPARVMDDITCDMIEIPELFRAVNHTKTLMGAATLFRSLVQPLDSLDLIQAKQDSVRELKENAELSYRLNEYVSSLVEKENYVYQYFFGNFDQYSEEFGREQLRHRYQYRLYRGVTVFFKRLVDGIKNIPKPQTKYLKTLIEDIESLNGTRTIEMIKGPVYSTWGGLKSRKEVGFFTPKIKFTLRAMKPILVAALFLAPILAAITGNLITIGAALGIAGLLAAFSTLLALEFDYYHFTLPLRDIYVIDGNIKKGIETAGRIDELLSFHEYSKAMKGEAVMPVVKEASCHYFLAKEIKNPILLKEISYCVPNDVALTGQKLTFFTGPNSGGKTTYCKTIAQMQVLAQIGCYVPAKKAEMSMADRIFYQLPTFDSLKDHEGQFGVELRRTGDIFFHTSPKSLVVLDTLAEGTTHREKLKKSYSILKGFHAIGNNTLVITHYHELVNRFRDEGKGQYLQVEIKKRLPTHKIIPGVSTMSHADLISEKIGFSEKDIKEHLEKMNYNK